MYICIHEGSASDARGTLKEAFQQIRDEYDSGADIEDCIFYEVGKPIEVELDIQVKRVKEVLNIRRKE